MLTLIS